MNNLYYMNYYVPTGMDVYPNRSPYEVRENTQESRTFFDVNEGFKRGNLEKDTYDAYKSEQPTMPRVYTDREVLLLEVQKYAFAMNDLNLYLNTHHSDGVAMNLFVSYRNMYQSKLDEYQKKYGLICLNDVNVDTYWQWNKGPWPWENK